MNVVDSSGWLEFFKKSERTAFFREAILNTERLLVPVICLYEVFKTLSRQRTDVEARQAIATMQQGRVVALSPELALHAAQLSLKHSLPMADASILATAYSEEAELWTQDADFEGLPNVRYFPR
ncbi:MAG: type II toxin-antitoxin system VapC family toxin [Acidobacteria bacterium]|nr:type II toxin-antitoxin system VapC family toxin [Acidobacteriota bacterium]